MAATAALTAIIIGGVTTGAQTGYNIYQSKQDKSEAIDEKGKMESEAFAEKKKAEKKLEEEKSAREKTLADAALEESKLAKRNEDRRRSRSAAGSRLGYKGGTILTGPRGLQSPSTTAPKTLLGQ